MKRPAAADARGNSSEPAQKAQCKGKPVPSGQVREEIRQQTHRAATAHRSPSARGNSSDAFHRTPAGRFEERANLPWQTVPARPAGGPIRTDEWADRVREHESVHGRIEQTPIPARAPGGPIRTKHWAERDREARGNSSGSRSKMPRTESPSVSAPSESSVPKPGSLIAKHLGHVLDQPQSSQSEIESWLSPPEVLEKREKRFASQTANTGDAEGSNEPASSSASGSLPPETLAYDVMRGVKKGNKCPTTNTPGQNEK